MVIGTTVTVTIDRPIGSTHPQYNDVIYPLNYGYVEGVFGGDGQEQDCYILGVNVPIKTFTGTVIAVITRDNDTEDKWVVSNQDYSIEEIRKQTYFIEQYFTSRIKK